MFYFGDVAYWAWTSNSDYFNLPTISGTFEIVPNFFTISFSCLDDSGNFKHYEVYLFLRKNKANAQQAPV